MACTLTRKILPQIPNALIQELSSVGDVVADVFCGSGTTVVEALTLKRHAIGIDANPLACLITDAKTTSLSRDDVERLQALVAESGALGDQLAGVAQQGNLFATSDLMRGFVPDHKAVEFWFDPIAVEELSHIHLLIGALPSAEAKTLALAAFSSIIVSVSRQDSDTRYTRREKHLQRGDVLKRFARALADAVRAAIEFTELIEPRFTRRIVHASVLDEPNVGRFDLLVCSPPYPNAYSYHLYHMTRMLWLGMDQPTFKKVEIGSHRKYSARGPRAATIETFIAEMSTVFAWLRDSLRVGGYACFVVGDSIIGGTRHDNASTLSVAARRHGFTEVARLERRLQDTRKAFNPAIGKIKAEHVLILENSQRWRDPTSVAASNRTSSRLSACSLWMNSRRLRRCCGESRRLGLCQRQDRHTSSSADGVACVLGVGGQWAG